MKMLWTINILQDADCSLNFYIIKLMQAQTEYVQITLQLVFQAFCSWWERVQKGILCNIESISWSIIFLGCLTVLRMRSAIHIFTTVIYPRSNWRPPASVPVRVTGGQQIEQLQRSVGRGLRLSLPGHQPKKRWTEDGVIFARGGVDETRAEMRRKLWSWISSKR